MEKVIKLQDIKNLKGKDRIRIDVMTLIEQDKLKVHEVLMEEENE